MSLDNKLKIHIYGLPHTITTRDDPRFMTCAFTTKVYLLTKKLHEMGHEVVHYGVEGSDVPCSENVEYIPFDLWDKTHGQRKVEGWQEHEADAATYEYAKKHLAQEINSRIKDPSREVVLASFGHWAHELSDINKAALIEYGIGYGGTFTSYRCFESYNWQHVHHGKDDHIDYCKWYDAVIPGYIEEKEFTFNAQKDDYLLCVGRIMNNKGVFVAEQLAREYGLKLIVAGNGETEWIKDKPHVEYVGVVGVEQKRELFKNAKATMCMSFYTEPFGNVHVESLMSGTPVITTDWGVYTETVPHGQVGYRGRTWEDFKYAVENIDQIDPQKCRDWAMANFSMEAVYPAFEQYFEKCAAHFVCKTDEKTHSSQWYVEQPNYTNNFWNYQDNYEKFTKTHILMVCNNPFIDMALKSLSSFATYHDNYDITIIDCGLSDENRLRLSALQGFKTFIKSPTKFLSFDKRVSISQSNINPTWLKYLLLQEIENTGRLLILDADTYFFENITDFLTFNNSAIAHAVDDYSTFQIAEDFNLARTGSNTYFHQLLTNKFTNYKSYKDEVTLNAGVFVLNLNCEEGIQLKERLCLAAQEIHTKLTTWPYDQGVLNHLLYSLEYVKNKKVEIFDYRYNSSAYNHKNTYKAIKLLHYHKPETLQEALNYRVLN